MSDKLFRLVEPSRLRRSIVGYLKKEYIYDYIAEHEMFCTKEYMDTYDNCLAYRSKLADMFREMAEEIECCILEEAHGLSLDEYEISKDDTPHEERVLLYGIRIKKVNTDEHKETNKGNKKEIQE